MKNYTCAICGMEHFTLDGYLACVSKCGEELKKQKENKRLEEVNAALNRVKQAKDYYEKQLVEFKEKYPEEYKLNFGTKDTEKCNCKHKSANNDGLDNWLDDITTISCEINEKGKPVIKTNGKEVTNEFVKDLFNDPELKYVGKLLGLI